MHPGETRICVLFFFWHLPYPLPSFEFLGIKFYYGLNLLENMEAKRYAQES